MLGDVNERDMCLPPAQKDWHAYRIGLGLCYLPAVEPGRSTGYSREDFLALAGGDEAESLALFAACLWEDPEFFLDRQVRSLRLKELWRGRADYRRFLGRALPRAAPLAPREDWALWSEIEEEGIMVEHCVPLSSGEAQAEYLYMGILASLRAGEKRHIHRLGILLNGTFHSLWNRRWIAAPWGDRAWWVEERRRRLQSKSLVGGGQWGDEHASQRDLPAFLGSISPGVPVLVSPRDLVNPPLPPR